jgi:hypothetical protein
VLRVEAAGHEQLDGLAQQFVAVVAKRLFDLRINQHDLALPINHHHAVGQVLDELLETLVGPLALRRRRVALRRLSYFFRHQRLAHKATIIPQSA